METFEVFLLIDIDGSYEVGVDADDVIKRFSENIGDTAPCRMIKLNVKASLPVEIAADVVVPDDAGTHVEASAEA